MKNKRILSLAFYDAFINGECCPCLCKLATEQTGSGGLDKSISDKESFNVALKGTAQA